MRIISHFAVLVAVLVVAVVPVAIAGTAGAARSSTTPPIGRQLAELKGSDTEGSYSANIAGEGSGLSVAISDRIAVVAAYAHANGAGRAYVFTKAANGWKQTAELKGSGSTAHAGL